MSKVLDEEDEDMVRFEPNFPFVSSVIFFASFSLFVNLKLAKCFCASFILLTEEAERAGMVALRALFRINIRSVLVSRFLFSSIV